MVLACFEVKERKSMGKVTLEVPVLVGLVLLDQDR